MQCILPGDLSLPQDRSRRAAQTNLAGVLPRPSLSGWVPGQPADLRHKSPRPPFVWPPGAQPHAEPASGQALPVSVCLWEASLRSVIPGPFASARINFARHPSAQLTGEGCGRILAMPPATRQPASSVPSLGLPGGELLAGSSPEQGWGGPTASHQPDLPSVVPSVNFFNGTPLRTKQ